jgi:hypothetical protein
LWADGDAVRHRATQEMQHGICVVGRVQVKPCLFGIRLAIYFGAAVLSLQEWNRERHQTWAVLVMAFSFARAQLKLPGLVLGAITLTVFAVSLIHLSKAAKLTLVAIVAIRVADAIFISIDATVPFVGHIGISNGKIELPYLGSYLPAAIRFCP